MVEEAGARGLQSRVSPMFGAKMVGGIGMRILVDALPYALLLF